MIPNFADEVESLDHGIIMVETSGRARLSPRQACSVESAARRSGLPVNLILLSSQLDLTDNTTCQLVSSDIKHKINVFTLDLHNISYQTPLEGFFSSEELLGSPSKLSHISDGLRYLLVHKYGGIYMGKLLQLQSHLSVDVCVTLQILILWFSTTSLITKTSCWRRRFNSSSPTNWRNG